MAKLKLYVPSVKGRKINLSVPREDAKAGESKYSKNIFIGDGGYKTDDENEQKYLDNHELNGSKFGFIEKELGKKKASSPEDASVSEKENSEKEETDEVVSSEDDDASQSELELVSTINDARNYMIKNHGMSARVSNPETIKEKAEEAEINFPNFTFPE